MFRENKQQKILEDIVLALDMTARTIQYDLIKQGHPWLLAKGFDTSCPCGDFIDKNQLDPLTSSVNLWLSVNGT